MNKYRYDIDDIVYIVFWDNVIECIVKEIHITDSNINYKLQNKQKSIDVYLRNEDEIYKTCDEAKKFIQKRNLINRINDEESKAVEYREWISQLDKAIRNYESCETHIKVKLLSSQTNGEDENLISVTSTSSKTLLEYLQKYFKEELEERENILEKLKKEKNEIEFLKEI